MAQTSPPSFLSSIPSPQTHTHKPSNPRDRDSGVFLSDTEDLPQTPTSAPPLPAIPPPPKVPSRTDSTTRRLRRPAELNLSSSPSSSSSPQPKSELQLRHDLIRNSSTQSRAALKSPTQLLKQRLDLSPKKAEHEEKIRVFTPPRPMLNGCILPGPEKQLSAFGVKDVDVCARTVGGRPAWWCKFDKLVIFDGAELCAQSEGGKEGEMTFVTRTSKGLSVARRRGDAETVVIPMACTHCQEMLNRSEWKVDVRVCRRSVCWECKERCAWEMEKEQKGIGQHEEGEVDMQVVEGNRERADSVLQDERIRDDELMRKVGIEHGPRSPIEIVGGIEERLEVDAVDA